MSGQRYTPEFKDEAVKQVIGRGNTIAEVSERLSVSYHTISSGRLNLPPEWQYRLGHCTK